MTRLDDKICYYFVEDAEGFGEGWRDGGGGTCGGVGCWWVGFVCGCADDAGEVFLGGVRVRVGDVGVDWGAGAVEEGAQFFGEVEGGFVSARAGAGFHVGCVG